MTEHDDLVATWGGWSTGVVFDALQRVGVDRYIPGVMPVTPEARVVGRAFTVGYRPSNSVSPGTVGDFIDEVPEGAVVVLSSPGRDDCTIWGDILTLVAHQRGVAGTVIDGACRDTSRAVELAYPLFARRHTMRTGKTRVEVAEVGGRVALGEANVGLGDLVVADRDGVCVVPWERVDEVAEAAAAIDLAERQIEQRVLSGSSLAQARSELGYFALQDKT